MPYMTLTAMQVTLGSTNYSDQINKAELTVDVDENDVTTYASQGWKEVDGGLKSGQLALSGLNEYEDDGLQEVLWSNFGTTMTFTVKASSASTSVSNPEYSGKVLIKPGKILGGQVGQVDTFDITLPTSGAVSRTTS